MMKDLAILLVFRRHNELFGPTVSASHYCVSKSPVCTTTRILNRMIID